MPRERGNSESRKHRSKTRTETSQQAISDDDDMVWQEENVVQTMPKSPRRKEASKSRRYSLKKDSDSKKVHWNLPQRDDDDVWRHSWNEGLGASDNSSSWSNPGPVRTMDPGGTRNETASSTDEIIRLKEQLVAMKVQARALEEELLTARKSSKEDRTAYEELEAEHIDMQHDLAETRRVKDRLERENNHLRKKLVKRQAEVDRLRSKLDCKEEVSGDESQDTLRSYLTSREEPYDKDQQTNQESFNGSFKSVWSLLADETATSTEYQSPVLSSRGNLFDSLFRNANSSNSTITTMTSTLSSIDVSPSPVGRKPRASHYILPER